MACVKPMELTELLQVYSLKNSNRSEFLKMMDNYSDDQILRRMSSNHFLSIAKGTPVEDVYMKIIASMRSLVSNISPSWRWKALRTLPVSTTEKKHFFKNCIAKHEDIARLLTFLFTTIIPAECFGEHNRGLLMNFLATYMLTVKLPGSYPNLKICDTVVSRACRSKVFQARAAEMGVPVNMLQRGAQLHLIDFCSKFVCSIAMQFVINATPRYPVQTERTLYSRRGFNFWKKKEINMFVADYQLKPTAAMIYKKYDEQLVSQVRVMVTSNGESLRPICPFNKKTGNEFYKYVHYLKSINVALDFHMKASGSPPVISTFKTMRKVKNHLNNLHTEFPGKRVYYVKADVTKCFANIDHKVLHEALRDLIGERSVVVTKVHVIAANHPKLQIFAAGATEQEASAALATIIKNKGYRRNETIPMFKTFSGELVERIMSVVRGLRFRVDLDERKTFRMNRGVPQGCIISSRLSHIYLCAFDRSRFDDLQEHSRYFRYADDYLFVLNRKDKAMEVLDRIQKPLNAFGLNYRKEKTQTSFETTFSKRKGRYMVWCGYTIDTSNNKVLPVGIRKVNGISTTRALLARLSGHERAALRRRLRSYDSKIESEYNRK